MERGIGFFEPGRRVLHVRGLRWYNKYPPGGWPSNSLPVDEETKRRLDEDEGNWQRYDLHTGEKLKWPEGWEWREMVR